MNLGALCHIALKKAKVVNKKCKFGVVGDHCHDCSSVLYFEKIGIDYIYANPSFATISVLAAAKAHCILVEKMVSPNNHSQSFNNNT